MTYNVFSGTLNPTQSVSRYLNVLSDADECKVSSVLMTDADRDDRLLSWWKLHIDFSMNSSAAGFNVFM